MNRRSFLAGVASIAATAALALGTRLERIRPRIWRTERFQFIGIGGFTDGVVEIGDTFQVSGFDHPDHNGRFEVVGFDDDGTWIVGWWDRRGEEG